MSVAEEKPAVDAMVLKLLEAVPFQLTTDGGVEAARQRFRELPRREVRPEVRTEDRTINGPAGKLPIRVYWPPNDGESTPPVVVFFHGGGWSVGDLDTYDGEARGHAVGADAVVVSVDYRLAPELAVAGHDPLRDDGARYAELLTDAGVPAELHNAETLIHGYLGYAGVVPAATEATERGLSALREALHRA